MNTIKFTKICDHRGRTLLDATFRPGRQHDQTALQTDGIDDLLEQFPDVTCEMDAGYRGLHRDHPGQVSVPPKKPAKNAAPEVIKAWEQARHGQSSTRICVEHAIADSKNWRSLQRWTGRREDLPETIQAIGSTGIRPRRRPVTRRHLSITQTLQARTSRSYLRTTSFVWLAYPASWQPRLPDPSYASPALVVVPEDKSGTALAWILPFHRDVLSTVARRRDAATGAEARCRTTRSGQQPASAWRKQASRMPPPAARSSGITGRPEPEPDLVLQREMVRYRLQRYGPDVPVGGHTGGPDRGPGPRRRGGRLHRAAGADGRFPPGHPAQLGAIGRPL